MPSPFPGMNPYLEQPGVWHDFHQAFITAIRNALTPQIRPEFIAKIDDHIYIHELSGDERKLLGRPDVAIVEGRGAIATAAHSTAVTAPAFGQVSVSVDVVHESYIEILDRDTQEVITVIELLSPTNKTPGSDREQYLGKRKAILACNTHLVEIDLLRGGERMPVANLPECDYVVMVSRSYERPQVELWPLRLRDLLPLVPVPLRLGRADATIDLGQLFQEQFEAAGYGDYVYRGVPQPSLRAEDAKWAAEFVGATAK
jgi:hypothetical protein